MENQFLNVYTKVSLWKIFWRTMKCKLYKTLSREWRRGCRVEVSERGMWWGILLSMRSGNRYAKKSVKKRTLTIVRNKQLLFCPNNLGWDINTLSSLWEETILKDFLWSQPPQAWPDCPHYNVHKLWQQLSNFYIPSSLSSCAWCLMLVDANCCGWSVMVLMQGK